MKKIIQFAGLIAMTCTLQSCNIGTNNSSTITTLDKKEIVAQSINMLSYFEGGMSSNLSYVKMRNSDVTTSASSTTSSPIDQDEKVTIQSLLLQFDNVFNDNSNMKVTVLESNNDKYTNLYKVEYYSLLDSSTSFLLYFNEVNNDFKQNISNHKNSKNNNGHYDMSDDSEEFDDEEEQETKTVSKIEGLVIKDEINYDLSAHKKIETELDDGKTETESKLSVTLRSEDGIIIHVQEKEEIENDEREKIFSYKIIDTNVQGNNIIDKYSIKTKIDNNERELELTTNKNIYKIEEIIENGETFYKVKYKSEKSDKYVCVYKKVITADPETGLE